MYNYETILFSTQHHSCEQRIMDLRVIYFLPSMEALHDQLGESLLFIFDPIELFL